jgi:hypothetical protein
MTTSELFHGLQASPAGAALRSASHVVAEFAGVVHVLGLVLLGASVLLLGLRLLGIGLARQPVHDVAAASRPLFMLGLALVVPTGLVLLLPNAVVYESNAAFWPKMEALAIALALQVALYAALSRRWFPGPWLARGAGLLSLAAWLAVGVAGRAIGFV